MYLTLHSFSLKLCIVVQMYKYMHLHLPIHLRLAYGAPPHSSSPDCLSTSMRIPFFRPWMSAMISFLAHASVQ